MNAKERVEQIRRANASWQPKPAQNPAAFHAKNDIDFLLGVIDEFEQESAPDEDDGPAYVHDIDGPDARRADADDATFCR